MPGTVTSVLGFLPVRSESGRIGTIHLCLWLLTRARLAAGGQPYSLCRTSEFCDIYVSVQWGQVTLQGFGGNRDRNATTLTSRQSHTDLLMLFSGGVVVWWYPILLLTCAIPNATTFSDHARSPSEDGAVLYSKLYSTAKPYSMPQKTRPMHCKPYVDFN
jgi:hypothetical protein